MTSLTQKPFEYLFSHYAFSKPKSVHPSECCYGLDGSFSFAYIMFVMVQLERLLQSPVTGRWHVVDFNNLFAHCAFPKPKCVHHHSISMHNAFVGWMVILVLP